MIICKNNEIKDNENIERIEVNVKWFSPKKGYGYIYPVDG
jgi:hypothetical protein